jgi:hypothetical protein
MFRGNVQHTGVYDAPGVPSSTASAGSSRPAGASTRRRRRRRGVVRRQHRRQSVRDRRRNRRRAVEVRDEGRVVSSPAVQNGVVYFASYDSNFYAVDAASGALKWKFETKGEKAIRGRTHPRSSAGVGANARPVRLLLSSPAWRPASSTSAGGDGKRLCPRRGRGHRESGRFRPAMWCMRPRRWRRVCCSSAAGTRISTPSTPRLVWRNGDSRPETTRFSTTRRGSSPRRQLPTASSTSGAAIQSSTRSTS